MQSDIVQRLQEKWCGHSGMDESHLVNPDGPEAAAEITRLTEALRAADEREKALREALAWYGEKAAGCRKITREGDDARYALDRDRGERARQALAGAKP